MNDAIDTLPLLSLTTRLLCVGLVLQSIELLVNARELRNDGLLRWPDQRGRLFGAQGKLRWLYTSPACLVVFTVRAFAAVAALFLPFDAAPMPWVLAVLAGTQAYHNHRLKMIHEGSDSMYLLGLAALLAAAVEPAEPRLRAAALGFLAFQAVLAYFAAGLDKVRSVAWRDGSLLTRALRYGVHRFEPLGDALARHPALAIGLSQSVIFLELLFPLSVVLPPSAFWIFASAGVVFHLGVAFCMGLHGFFWSFIATYPAVYFVSQKFAARWPGWLSIG
jgi:hypothetical protein